MRRIANIAALVAAVALAGCGAGAGSDAPADAAPAIDAAPELDDAGGDPALFEVSGDCGVLDGELTAAAPSRFANRMAFAHAYTDADEALLTPGGREIIADGNAGGSSLYSEVFAHEVLAACEPVDLVKTETEIVYDGPSTKTDFSADIGGVRIGVSVTRAQTFPLGSPLSVDAARGLLDGKLADIIESSANVTAADAWQKQILAVMIYDDQHLGSIETALAQIDAATRADTIVWLTVTDGPDGIIYE